jgi:hypothetical protein
MVPAQIERRIAVHILELLRQAKQVAPKISRKIQAVVGVELITEFGVEVVKVRRILLSVSLRNRCAYEARPPTRMNLCLSRLAFGQQTTRYQSDTAIDVEAFTAAVFLVNVEHR